MSGRPSRSGLAEAEVRAAMAERGIVRRAYIRCNLDPPPEMLPSDFAAPLSTLNEARRVLGRHEQAMRNYQDRRAALPGRKTSREAVADFEVV